LDHFIYQVKYYGFITVKMFEYIHGYSFTILQ